MVALNRFWTLTSPIPLFFTTHIFDSAFVFYLIGISGKQLDALDWIDERLGSFSLALREISLLDSPQLKHPLPASVESFLSRFCRRRNFLLFLSASLAISALLKNL